MRLGLAGRLWGRRLHLLRGCRLRLLHGWCLHLLLWRCLHLLLWRCLHLLRWRRLHLLRRCRLRLLHGWCLRLLRFLPHFPVLLFCFRLLFCLGLLSRILLHLVLFRLLETDFKGLQQVFGQLGRHDIQEFALQFSFYLQGKTDHHHLHAGGEIFFFKTILTFNRKRNRRRYVYGIPKKFRERGGRRPHHLVHDLADCAHINFIHFKFFIWYIGPHEHSHDNPHVVATEHHDIAALKALRISYLHAYRRLQALELKFIACQYPHHRCGNVHLCAQHGGNRCGGRTKADIHYFAYGVQFHIIKVANAHFYLLLVSSVLTCAFTFQSPVLSVPSASSRSGLLHLLRMTWWPTCCQLSLSVNPHWAG